MPAPLNGSSTTEAAVPSWWSQLGCQPMVRGPRSPRIVARSVGGAPCCARARVAAPGAALRSSGQSPPTRSTTRSHGAPHTPQARSELPASTHGSISFGGNTAKWAPGNGWVATVQTDRLLRPLRPSSVCSPRSNVPHPLVKSSPGWSSARSSRRPPGTVLSHCVGVVEIPRRLLQQEQVLVSLRRPVRHRLRHRVRLRPDDVRAEIPAVGTEGERHQPRDAERSFDLAPRARTGPLAMVECWSPDSCLETAPNVIVRCLSGVAVPQVQPQRPVIPKHPAHLAEHLH